MAHRFLPRLPYWSVVVGSVLLELLVVFLGLRSIPSAQASRPITPHLPLTTQPGFLFRFDAGTQAFFTVTLPPGGLPQNVAVTGTAPSQVWLTEPGLNQIDYLVYTSTADFVWSAYPITSTPDSEPFRLTLDGNSIWFTERSANRIGRLDTTTHQIDEFYDHGLSANAGLADLKVAPDGSVWATAQWSNRLVHLTITSTTDYAFIEYTHTLLSSPFGLAIDSSNPAWGDQIWMASPGSHRIGRFTPGNASFPFDWPGTFPTDSLPSELIAFYNGTGKPYSGVWFSDRARNGAGLLILGTFTFVSYFNPITQAVGLARESENVFWLTQQDQQGALTRLTYTNILSSQIDLYPLPTPGLWPTGVAVAPDHGVWLAAYLPNRVYLPILARN